MWFLAQTYNYQVNSSGGVSFALIVLCVAFVVIALAAYWKIFTKAGQAGWKSLIPIYSTVILCRIIGISGWYTLLIFAFPISIIFTVYLYYKLAKSFGYGIGMTILELFLIGALILGYGSAKYLGPEGKPAKQ